ncbi:MAG TPA: HEAT repeat domain-containing protein [Gemmatimonadales bacterium]|nr:HEAT repeat domain-containing protein [Gemmatimonadales bacterium]
MTARHFLTIVAIVQGALLAALLVLIILNRWFRLRRSTRLNPRREAVDASMRRWAAGSTPMAGVLVGLARLPTPLAIDALVKWSARVPGERWRQLAEALEHHWWARLVRTNATSARWWKRLECARFLSVAAVPRDVDRLTRLINDPHPAVHVAAVASLERMENTALTLTALDRLPLLAPTVQAYYAAMLLRSRPVVIEHLQKRLRRTDDPALARLAEFAARLAEPGLRERLTALADHADSEVRIQSARALGSFPHRESVAALRRLVTDDAWAVRAQAVRSLGMITDASTLPLVKAALQDNVWWVRLRAALALMRFAAPGRNALLEAEIGANPFASAMAKMVLGLPAQALAEFAA